MADLWQDEGFGGGGSGVGEAFAGDDWDEGEESIETDVEDGFDDPDEDEDDASEDDGGGE
jgi:hypothetical protein